MSFGYEEFGTTSWGLDLSADGHPEMKHGGGTIDWDTVTVLASPLTLPGGRIIAAGRKILLPGQLMLGITRTGVSVVALGETPTGGTWDLTIANTLPAPGGTGTLTGLAYNVALATLQAAIRALPNIDGAAVVVTGTPGTTYTITSPQELGTVTVTVDGDDLTGAGADPTATVTTTEEGGDTGKIGPYDSAAADGRQTIADARFDCGLVRFPILMKVAGEGEARNDIHCGLIIGGPVRKDLIRATSGSHSLAAGPTWAELKTLLPRLVYVGGLRAAHT
jgi:hypothetical protein